MPGELFDSYGRPVVIPVAFDDSSGLTDNYGRPLQVVNALPLSGGTLTGDLNIGANKIKTTNVEIGFNYITVPYVNAGYVGITANASYLCGPNGDDQWFNIKARDNTVGTVEIARVQGAADPYFRIGRDDTGVALNATTDMLVIQAGGGGGNAAAGMGAGVAFNLSNSVHEVEKRASITCSLTAVTNGAESSKLALITTTAGVLTEKLTIDTSGVTCLSDTTVTGGLGVTGVIGTSSGLNMNGANITQAAFLGGVNVDNYPTTFYTRDNSVGMVEIARLQGAADPYFRIGRDDTGVALNATTDMLVIQAGGGGGNAAAGMGAGISFNLSNAAHEIEKRGSISLTLTTATNGAETTQMAINLMKAGAPQACAFFDTDGNFSTTQLNGAYFISSNCFWSSASVDSAAAADAVKISGYDISAGHRALSIGTEEVVVSAAAGASDAYVPIRYNGVTYKLLLHT